MHSDFSSSDAFLSARNIYQSEDVSDSSAVSPEAKTEKGKESQYSQIGFKAITSLMNWAASKTIDPREKESPLPAPFRKKRVLILTNKGG